MEVIEQWLCATRGKSVNLHVPKKGDKKHQIDLAVKNAKEEFEKYRTGISGNGEKLKSALGRLEGYLEMKDSLYRIEAYDISNTGNRDIVAGMVVFIDGQPEPSHYRKFNIKSVDTQNDYASMQEVITEGLKERILRKSSEKTGFISRMAE